MNESTETHKKNHETILMYQKHFDQLGSVQIPINNIKNNVRYNIIIIINLTLLYILMFFIFIKSNPGS